MIVLVLVFGLAGLLSSPDVPQLTIANWAKVMPNDFLGTAAIELNGTSETATYGPPYNNGTRQRAATAVLPADLARGNGIFGRNLREARFDTTDAELVELLCDLQLLLRTEDDSDRLLAVAKCRVVEANGSRAIENRTHVRPRISSLVQTFPAEVLIGQLPAYRLRVRAASCRRPTPTDHGIA